MRFVDPQHKQSLLTFYRKHSRCNLCPISVTNKIFWRGYVPAKMLLVGEAPGPVEHLQTTPFTGPSGTLLLSIISLSQETTGFYPWCMTNTICCTPFSRDGNKIREPSVTERGNCWPRLSDFVDVVEPEVIVTVGSIADDTIESDASILHPAYILRQPEHQQPELILQQVSKLVRAIEA